MRLLVLVSFLLSGAFRCLAGPESMQDMHGITKAISAYCNEEIEIRRGKTSWPALNYSIESPLIPVGTLLGISYESDVCIVFYRRYTAYLDYGGTRIVELYTDQQWFSLCQAMREYRKNWWRDRIPIPDRDQVEALSVLVSRFEIPTAIDVLVRKGWNIPAERFRAKWILTIIGA